MATQWKLCESSQGTWLVRLDFECDGGKLFVSDGGAVFSLALRGQAVFTSIADALGELELDLEEQVIPAIKESVAVRPVRCTPFSSSSVSVVVLVDIFGDGSPISLILKLSREKTETTQRVLVHSLFTPVLKYGSHILQESETLRRQRESQKEELELWKEVALRYADESTVTSVERSISKLSNNIEKPFCGNEVNYFLQKSAERFVEKMRQTGIEAQDDKQRSEGKQQSQSAQDTVSASESKEGERLAEVAEEKAQNSRKRRLPEEVSAMDNSMTQEEADENAEAKRRRERHLQKRRHKGQLQKKFK